MNIRTVQLYKTGDFVERCMMIVEDHMDDNNFSVATLAREMGMSHSALYKKLKMVSGQPVNVFIRRVRLRKAAEIMINSGHNINEVAAITGFTNIKFFRQYFNQHFGMKPSEYIKNYRKPFQTRLSMKHILE